MQCAIALPTVSFATALHLELKSSFETIFTMSAPRSNEAIQLRTLGIGTGTYQPLAILLCATTSPRTALSSHGKPAEAKDCRPYSNKKQSAQFCPNTGTKPVEGHEESPLGGSELPRTIPGIHILYQSISRPWKETQKDSRMNAYFGKTPMERFEMEGMENQPWNNVAGFYYQNGLEKGSVGAGNKTGANEDGNNCSRV